MRRRRRANNQLPEESEKRISKTMMRRNAMILLECSTAWAFRWFHSAFFCSYCDAKFVDVPLLRTHVKINHLNESPTDRIFSKLTENNMVKVDVAELSCRLCSRILNSIDALKDHLLIHGKTLNVEYSDGVLPFKLDEEAFTCQMCFEPFQTFAKMNEHMNTHFQNYICDSCGKAFVSKSRFRKHVQSHEKGSFPCGECDEILETRASRMCHRMKVHRKGIRYACPRCPEAFTTYHARAKHLVDTHAQQKKEYFCNACDKSFESSSKRAGHIRLTHANIEKRHYCPNCPSVFVRRIDLKVKWRPKRKYNDHRDNAAIILECSNACPFRWKRGAFTCAFCPLSFGEFSGVKTHSIEHPNKVEALRLSRTFANVKAEVTNLQCELCQTRMTDLDALSDHLISVHNKPIITKHGLGVTPFYLSGKEFNCTHCDETFELFSKLNTHLNTHYPNSICFQCGKAFSSISRLKSHLIIHDPEAASQYKCTKCDQVFPTRVLRNSHITLTHGPENRYRCPYCRRTVIQVDSNSENKVPEETIAKMRGRQRRATFRNNIAIIMRTSTAYPFKYTKGAYLCYFCTKTFIEPEKLREHNQTNHFVAKNNLTLRKYEPIKMDFEMTVCKICDTRINDYAELKEHLVTHGKTIDCTFEDCVMPYKLNREEYNCQVCGKTYEKFLSLHKHMNTHYEHHICETCGKAFATYQRLVSHIKGHHTVGGFRCKHCSETFQSYRAYYAHDAKVHRNNYRYKCPICNEKFSSYKFRLRHLVKIHGSETPFPEMRRRIVPLFQVAYDRSLCRPLGTLIDFSRFRKNTVKSLSPPPREFSPERSPSPVSFTKEPSPFIPSTQPLPVQEKTVAKKNPDVRQNALAVFEFSTVYPFVYSSNKFKCFVCSQPFLELKDLKIHMAATHNFAPLKRLVNNRRENILKVDVSDILCKICSERPNNLVELKKHLKEIHNKPLNLDIQDNMIPFKLELDEDGYKCVICERNFIKVRVLVIHMSEHFNNYSCEICGSVFMTLRLLKKHLEVHDSGNYPCDRCNKVFSTPYKRTLHIRGVHLKQCPRRCPMCPEKFNSNYKRAIHLQDVHNQETKVHKCKTCGRAFNLKYHLVCHVRSVHLQERNHQCDVCHQRFCNKESLKRHMVIHTGEKNHKCDVCGMAFLRRKNLKDHLRLHDIS
ncbi:hypothetical protein HF086_009526 [Spodoptera exigua]|uniref:C2H2-type domain-containing protein n=1 Tax=Spodoptera exigua TaxID=7107 RepID=A0A922MEJ1_SPOEX|nr:hypothetical protein HF086_009526 [Spodoptera exigua]